MAILTTGNTFADGDQVTSTKLNNIANAATFASGAVDDSTTQLSSGAIIVKDLGVSTGKIAASAVTTAKINASAVTTAKIADSNVTKAKIEDFTNLTVLGNVSGSAATPAEVTILDEDNMASDSATSLATQQSIKAYVDTQLTAEDLDFAGDTGTGSVDLDSQTFTIAGATGLDTTASSQTLTVALDLNELATETTIAQDDFVIMVDNTDSGNGKITFSNLEDEIFGNVSGDILIAAGGAATIQPNSVALGTDTTGNYVQSVTNGSYITGGDGGSESAALTLAVDATSTNTASKVVARDSSGNFAAGTITAALTGNVTGNVTGDLTGNVTATSVLANGVTATTQTSGDNSTKVATTAYVDAQVGTSDALSEVLANGNTTGANNIIVTAGQAITTDTVSETTAAAGVTVDSLLIKDGGITAAGTSTFAGQTISDLGTVTTANIDGGSIDGTTVGASSASTGAFTTLTASDDVNFDSGTFFVDASADSVGIGTTSPGQKLEVNGGNIEIDSTGAVDSRIIFSRGGTNLAWMGIPNWDGDALYIYGPDAGGTTTDQVFSYTQDTLKLKTNASDALTINSSQNVGIGTTSPSSTLDVTGTLAVSDDANFDSGTLFVDASTDCVGIGITSAINTQLGGNAKLGAYDASGARIGIWGNGSRWWYLHGEDSNVFQIGYRGSGNTTDNDVITLNTFGNVGIGTTSISEKLTVSGNVSISGSISKGSGSFKIPHPLESKRDTYNLVHSFLESPQADLIYRGQVDLVDGVASVNIDVASGMTDGTFVLLCRDVQSFTTNESGWTAVRSSVDGNILTIEAQDNTCTDSISWMVIGERQDQHMYNTDWTDENGKVIVEPLIPEPEPQPVLPKFDIEPEAEEEVSE